jgi:hypothetical protein
MFVNEHLQVTTSVAIIDSRVGATAVLLSVFLENGFETSVAHKQLV